MRIENEFSVAAPPDETWAFLLDVERVAPCMPGAELTETIDATHWRGKVSLKFGPVAMAFGGTVEMTHRDDTARRVELLAKGTEARGKGAASATIASWVEPNGSGSTVKVQADITMTGAVAQLSRGLLPEVSKQLTGRFAERLRVAMGGGEAEPVADGGNSIDALGLGVKAVGGAIAGVFRRKDDGTD